MRIAAFDTVASSPPGALPLELDQSSSRFGSALMLAMVLPIVITMLVPFLMLLVTLAADPSARAVLAERPAAGLQIALGLALWSALFAWPVKRLVEKLVSSRRVRIADGTVEVTEVSLLGDLVWQARLGAFAGLAHHVRASLSGTRHELILVHPDRDRSVLIAVADRITQPEIDRMAALLGVAHLPTRALYDGARVTRPTATTALATAQV